MKKPNKKSVSYYDYHELKDYLISKGKVTESEVSRFWREYLSENEIHNGCFTYLPEDWDQKDKNGEYFYPEWMRKIIQELVKEFWPNNLIDDGKWEDMKVWVSW